MVISVGQIDDKETEKGREKKRPKRCDQTRFLRLKMFF